MKLRILTKSIRLTKYRAKVGKMHLVFQGKSDDRWEARSLPDTNSVARISSAGGVPQLRACRHLPFFPAAFWAAFVTLPAPPSRFLTPLMTPTATVWRMSRTAKRPSGAYSANGSTHIGFCGTISTMPASPDLRLAGLSSIFLPLRRSIFSSRSRNLQAMCDVWQSRTGA